MGFTDCPHVAYDLYILPCPNATAKEPCSFKITGVPDHVWLETREMGICHFCMLEEQDSKDKIKRRKEAFRRMDL